MSLQWTFIEQKTTFLVLMACLIFITKFKIKTQSGKCIIFSFPCIVNLVADQGIIMMMMMTYDHDKWQFIRNCFCTCISKRKTRVGENEIVKKPDRKTITARNYSPIPLRLPPLSFVTTSSPFLLKMIINLSDSWDTINTKKAIW